MKRGNFSGEIRSSNLSVSHPVVLDTIILVDKVSQTQVGKAVPLQAWSGPEGSRKLRFPDYMTTAHDGGKVSLTHRPPLPPGNAPGPHFY
jgi:hypothetical protein